MSMLHVLGRGNVNGTEPSCRDDCCGDRHQCGAFQANHLARISVHNIGRNPFVFGEDETLEN